VAGTGRALFGVLKHRKSDRSVHDLGFLFQPTWKAWYDLTGDSAKNQVVIDAGKTLALRFQPKGRYLRSFVSQDSIFIDIMMNVGIIFYAAQQTKDTSLLQIAVDHCPTTRRFLVRGDGSTSHEGSLIWKPASFCSKRLGRTKSSYALRKLRCGHRSGRIARTLPTRY
jgi:hypothetical protein